MAAAIVGLIGALLGAMTALIGSALADRRHARQEEARWRRDQRGAAYDGALRYLLRAANRRSGLSRDMSGAGKVRGILTKEHLWEWFNDLVEAQFWLHTLTSRCGAAQVDRIRQVADEVDGAMQFLTPIEGDEQTVLTDDSIVRSLQNAVRTVAECARLDGDYRPPLRSRRP
jgi:hypothetical protein